MEAETLGADLRKMENVPTGGVYVPPHRMRAMMRDVTDKATREYQKMAWDALKKSINGLINKVNTSNIQNIIPELFQENLVRGRGVMARALIRSQAASPAFSNVYGALLAVINTKMPEIGELVLKRLIIQFHASFGRNDKPVCLSSSRFIAHLVNQQVSCELLPLEMLTLLLENPTDDSVEVAIGFVKECGRFLADHSSIALHAIFERFGGILREGSIDKRVQYMIEGLFAVRRNNFADFPGVPEELDLVEADDQITHELSLDRFKEYDAEKMLDVFKLDENYEKNDEAYAEIRREILGEESESELSEESGGEEEEYGEGDVPTEAAQQTQVIVDKTDTDVVNLRRQIYLTIMSSLDVDECAHKLMQLDFGNAENELVAMVLECCSQERSYLRFYGLLGARFCLVDRKWMDLFDEAFFNQYATIHRLETNMLRNVAKFFAHLLYTDALSWTALSYIRLNEAETTSSSRIFIKILFQELAEYMGLPKLNERLNDPTLAEHFTGLLPCDTPKSARFAVNFFTSVGLGGLTDGLREYLKNAPKLIMQQQLAAAREESDGSSSSYSGSSSSYSGSSYSGSSYSGSSYSGSSSSRSGSSSSRSGSSSVSRAVKRARAVARKHAEERVESRGRSESRERRVERERRVGRERREERGRREEREKRRVEVEERRERRRDDSRDRERRDRRRRDDSRERRRDDSRDRRDRRRRDDNRDDPVARTEAELERREEEREKRRRQESSESSGDDVKRTRR